MADDLRPYLASLASEERSTAARALGRLHDAEARPTLQSLTRDPVEDVRLAAHHALEHRTTHTPNKLVREGGAGQPARWTTGGADDANAAPDGWQSALRKRFGSADIVDANDTAGADDTATDDDGAATDK
jgi:HEAT repeat protein